MISLKNISIVLITFFILHTSVSAARWDVVFLSQNTQFTQKYTGKTINLKKWFIVVESQARDNDIEVILTDGKVWYIDYGTTEFFYPDDIITANAGFTVWPTDLYTKYPSWYKRETWLWLNDVFFVKNMRLSNEKMLEVKIVSWNMRNRSWYIDITNTQLTCIDHLKYNVLENYFSLPTAIVNFFTPLCNPWDDVNASFNPNADIPIYVAPVIPVKSVNTPTSTNQSIPVNTTPSVPEINLPEAWSDLDLLKALEDIFN